MPPSTAPTFEQWAEAHDLAGADPATVQIDHGDGRQLEELRTHRDAWYEQFNTLAAVIERRGSARASDVRDLDRAEAQVRAFHAALEANTVHPPTPVATDDDSRGDLPRMSTTTTDPRVWARDDTPTGTAFRAWLRDGPPAEAELRAQGAGTGSAGGYLVPQGFRAKIAEALKMTGGVRAVADYVPTDSGEDLPFPTNNDTGNAGAILAENTQVTEQDLTVGQATLHAYMYTSKMVRVSIQLLQDNGFNLETWLATKLAQRIGRAQNPHLTTGTGSSQPQGIQPTATVGVTAAAVAAVTTDELIDLVHSVDPAYREDANGWVGWMMNDLTFAKIRKLKDSDGKYLVEPDVKAGLPNTLLGYPVKVNPDMPVMAASARSILFGNLTAGYVVRDVKQVELLRLVERYADYLQVGFLAYQRADGLIQDATAYKAIQNAAS